MVHLKGQRMAEASEKPWAETMAFLSGKRMAVSLACNSAW